MKAVQSTRLFSRPRPKTSTSSIRVERPPRLIYLAVRVEVSATAMLLLPLNHS